jgi:hypothetical protein
MKRFEQAILIVSFIAFSWLAMQVVHELGHVVAAWWTKAQINEVALHPCIISHTYIGHNPHPLIVVWAGPIVGAALPLLAFLVAKVCRAPGVYLFRFFAGVCLIANGVYITVGPSEGLADTGVMMEHGSPRWLMVLFGVITVPLGLYLWHGEGKHFGLGEAKGQVSRSAAVVSALLLIALAGAELIFNSK